MAPTWTCPGLLVHLVEGCLVEDASGLLLELGWATFDANSLPLIHSFSD